MSLEGSLSVSSYKNIGSICAKFNENCILPPKKRYKQGRDDIKVKVNIQSLIPISYYTHDSKSAHTLVWKGYREKKGFVYLPSFFYITLCLNSFWDAISTSFYISNVFIVFDIYIYIGQFMCIASICEGIYHTVLSCWLVQSCFYSIEWKIRMCTFWMGSIDVSMPQSMYTMGFTN